MDTVLDPDKLKTLASILAPGLIILTIRASVQVGPKPDLKDRLLHYAALSSIYYAAAWPVFHWPGGVILPLTLWTLLQYVVAPTVLGVLLAYEINGQWLRRLASRLGLDLVHPVPTAWDFAFSRMRQGTFVLVTLNNDSQIAGLLGGASFASSSREERDLLVERVWEIDGLGAWSELLPARSILLCGKDIRHVEIFAEAS